MPIVSYAHPAAEIVGNINAPHNARGLSTWTNPHAGQICGPLVPDPNTPTPLEQTIMDIHVLTGPKHSEAGQVTGTFLKATGPAAFAFVPHGLAADDVGALPLAAQAADSDKLDGSHASAFLGIHGTADAALDSDKLDGSHSSAFLAAGATAVDSDKLDGSHAAAFAAATHYHSALAASDLVPNPALSIDANAVCSIISPDTTKSLALKHDNSNARIQTSSGNIILQNLAADSPVLITIQGTGDTSASYSQIRMDDRYTSPAYLRLGIYNRAPFIDSQGTSKAAVQLQADGTLDLKCFNTAASGYTPALKLSGYRTADSLRTLALAVGSEAADTASISGLTNYKFTGSINATANLQTAGETRINNAGDATLATIAGTTGTFTGAVSTAALTAKATAEGGTPLDVRTTSATFGAGNDISLLTYQGALKTTNATATTILTIPIPTNSACTIDAILTVTGNMTPTHAQAIRTVALFRNAAGSVELCGDVTEIYNIGSATACSATITVSGTNALVVVTGRASTDFHWACTATRHITYIPPA